MNREEVSQGDPTHENHTEWLLELGRATRAAAQLSTICFDLARIVGAIDETELYDDPLGALERRLTGIDRDDLPLMPEFLTRLRAARHTRNDILHAFLVKDGLLRRSAKRGYDRDFYTVHTLQAARRELEAVSRLGGEILHANGGAEVEAWRQRLEPERPTE